MSSVSPRDGAVPPQAPRPLPPPSAPPEDGEGEGISTARQGEGTSTAPQQQTRARSPGHSPARKRLKVDLAGLSHSARVKRVREHRLTRLRQVSTACRENMTELFFLSTQRNIIDLPAFRKKPSSEFVNFLNTKKAPERVISEVQTAVLGSLMQSAHETRKHSYSPRVSMLPPVKVGYQQDVYNARAPPLPPPSRTLPPLPPASAPTYSIEQVHDKMRQEGWVIRRVAELSRDGLWPANRLPKVVEQPRPLAAWDMVLQEMKWMAADFQQERLWKQSAARVQAAAVKEFVQERDQRAAKEAAELKSRTTQRRVARQLAGQVKEYWSNVVSLHRYEAGKRRDLYLSRQLAAQLGHVTTAETLQDTTATTNLTSASRKRKMVETSLESGVITSSSGGGRTSPAPTIITDLPTPPPTENGGLPLSATSTSAISDDDDESTIEEQEAHEAENCVLDDEMTRLEQDACTNLTSLLRESYPGALTDYLTQHQWSRSSAETTDDEEEEDVVSAGMMSGDEPETLAPSHRVYSLHGLIPPGGGKERTSSSDSSSAALPPGSSDSNSNSSSKTNGDLTTRKDLIQLSETAEKHLPKSVINNASSSNLQLPIFKGCLRDYQTVAVQWLQTMYSEGLPAVLADETGLGRKVVAAAFISNLVNSVQSKGPHIVIVPSSTLHSWERTLQRFTPGLRLTVITPASLTRSQLQEILVLASPHVLITTYRTFFQFPALLTSTRWNVALLAEAQNLVSAGSPDQLRALADLASHHRVLVTTGPRKENPIDLWNLVHLLFPGVSCSQPGGGSNHHLVEGTAEYGDMVRKLQKLVASFTLTRTRHKFPLLEKQISSPNQVPMYVNLTNSQKKMYDDYLAKPNTQEKMKSGDLSSVCSLVQHLRNICNQSHLVDPSTLHPVYTPRLEEVTPVPARAVSRLLQTSPLDTVSLDNINLVFLKQELSTTVLTSARLRSLKASRELICELASSSDTPSSLAASRRHFPPPPRVPTGKLTFTLEGITRTVNGWNVPGGWVEGMGLVRAVSGQVFKVCANPTNISAPGGVKTSGGGCDTAPSPGMQLAGLKSVAEINHWRCSGFPLYGQDLISSLQITNSVRPARSRFCGQGYINCLNVETATCGSGLPPRPSDAKNSECDQRLKSTSERSSLWGSQSTSGGGCDDGVREKDDWRYRTRLLGPLLEVGSMCVETVRRGVTSLYHLAMDPSRDSAKLQALCRILEERYKNRERVMILVNCADLLPVIQQFLRWKSYRSLVVSGDVDLETKRDLLDRYSLDHRYFVLLLAATNTFAGLDIPKVGTVIEYDWTPLSSELTTRGLDWTPNTVFRLICRGTVEESTSRRALQRRIYQELDSNTDTPSIKRQTLEDLLRPPSDNGYFWTTDRKKKDKVKEEDEEALSQEVLSLLGLPCPDQSTTLLDLAELDSVQDSESHLLLPPLEDPDLMAWLEKVPPVQQYGMRQLSDNALFWNLDSWMEKEEKEDEIDSDLKLCIERDICRRGSKRKRQEECVEYVTYPSMLVNREWRDKEGELSHWKPPGYLDDIPDDTLTKLMYKATPMAEEDLPPVHVKKEKKRENSLGVSSSLVSSPASSLPASPVGDSNKTNNKIKREENVTAAPRSIFDRPKQFKAMPRPRGAGLGVVGTGGGGGAGAGAVNFISGATAAGGMSQAAGGMMAGGLANNLTAGGVGGKPSTPQDTGPDWLIQEDWALHQAVLSLQEMPLSLNPVSPAHISNWDLVADIVNAVSRCFRSARQCRSRYEATIQPREEGKILYNDIITPTKKQKKTKLNLKGQIQPAEKKPTISKPMKTSLLFKQDNNNAWSTQFASKFETIKSIANKRTPTTKPVIVNTTQRNPKHASVLADYNVVNYDQPLSPAQVAANKEERIKREKQRTQQQAQLAAVQQQTVVVSAQQQPVVGGVVQQQQSQQQPTQQVVASGHQTRLGVTSVPLPTAAAVVGNQAVASVNTSLPQAVVVSISQPVQQQQQQAQQQPGGGITSVGQITSVSRPVAASQQAVVTVSGVLPAGLQQNSSTLTRLAGGQIIVSQAGKAGLVAAGQAGGVNSTLVAGRPLTAGQIKVLQAQSLQKRQEAHNRQRQMQLSQAGGGGVSNNITAVVTTQTSTSVVAGITTGAATGVTRTVPGTSGVVGGRGQNLRPTNVRMSEADLKAIIAKQQLKVTAPGVVQVQPGSLSAAQLQQLGLHVATSPAAGGSTAALVKTAVPGSVQSSVAPTSVAGTVAAAVTPQQQLQPQPGKSVTIPIAGVNLQGQQVKAAVAAGRGTAVVAAAAPVVSGTAGTQQQHQQVQQIQQFKQLMMRKGVPQKVALQQVGGGKLPTQLIVQGAAGQQGKGLPATVTVQQLQQIMKNVAGGGQGGLQIGSVAGAPGQQVISHTVLAKPGGAPGQTVQARVIPVSGTGGRGQQTIQVVAAGPPVQRGGPNVTLDALSRQQGGAASAIASALAAGNQVKIATHGGATGQQILSQVTAALAAGHQAGGQPVSVAVRTPPAAASSGVVTSQLTARAAVANNTNVVGGGGQQQVLASAAGGGGQQTTALVVNQPQQQIGVPQQQQQIVTGVGGQQPQGGGGNSQQILQNQVVVSSQQQPLISSQPQLISSQHQLVSSQQQQLVTSQHQQLITTGQQQTPTTVQIPAQQQSQQQLVVNQPQQQIVTSQQQLVQQQPTQIQSSDSG